MTSIALVNSNSPFLVSDTIMPPLGLMYLSSYLKNNIPDLKVKIIDMASNKNTTIPDSYDIYAFTSTTPQYNTTLSTMKETKLKNPYSTFIIGGAHASCFQDKCLDDGFDCVIIGEGECALTNICNFEIEHASNNVKIRGTFKSKHIQNIDSIPFPDREFDGFQSYNYKINGKRTTTMITSRGCPFNCYFCCNVWGNNVRLRSPKNILKEVKQIKDHYNINSIQFYDDTFTVNKQRVIDICKGLKEFDITWRCFIHANTVTPQLLEQMHNSGCVEVGMGVESGSQKILNTINKKTTVEHNKETIKTCKNIGLRIKIFLMIGLPGESEETIQSTVKFLKETSPNDFDYTIYTPFPNTEIWNNQFNYDIKFNKDSLDYSKMFYKGISGRYTSQVSTSHLTSEKIEKYRDCVDTKIRAK